MPWCDTCNRFFNPNTLLPDGTCPNCGSQAAPPDESPAAARATSGGIRQGTLHEDATSHKVPWHFKVMVVATIGYLGWRIVEMIEQLL